MASTRLTFLYPHLFRSIRLAEGASNATRPCRRRVAGAPKNGRRRGNAPFAAAPLSTTPTSRQPPIARRHGKAVEPIPLGPPTTTPVAPPPPTPAPTPASAPTPSPQPSPDAGTQASAGKTEEQQQGKGDVTGAETTATTKTGSTTNAAPAESGANSTEGGVDGQTAGGNPSTSTTTTNTNTNTNTTPEEDKAASEARDEARAEAKKSGPLETMLHITGNEENSSRHPHLSPPPHVHHFDSYSLVRQLDGSGYTREQAITAMKAIRGLLAQNLDVAQQNLVSKSDVENETYLFRAACSELGTEVKNNRRVADEEMRRQRTLLQHEVDIITQSMNQELLTLNDNVRGMFNDRKIAVREEQKAVESTIQQINYKISISLSSDAKSEIEGLRWVLIRRSVIGILFMAVLTLGALRYGTYLSSKHKKEVDRIQKQAEMIKAADGKRDHSSGPDAAEILAAN